MRGPLRAGSLGEAQRGPQNAYPLFHPLLSLGSGSRQSLRGDGTVGSKTMFSSTRSFSGLSQFRRCAPRRTLETRFWGPFFFSSVKISHISTIVCSGRNVGANTNTLAHGTICPKSYMYILAHPKLSCTWARNYLHIANRLHVLFASSEPRKSMHNYLQTDSSLRPHNSLHAH